MDIEKAINLLRKEYEKVVHSPYIRNPLAYALYSVWKIADKEEQDE